MTINFNNNSISFFPSNESLSVLEPNEKAFDHIKEPVYLRKSINIPGFSEKLVDADVKRNLFC